MLPAIKTELKRAQDQYRLPGWFLGVVLGLPFALLITLVALTLPPFLRAVPWVWGENQSLESIQFLVFFTATVQGLVLAWHMAVQGETWYVWGFYLLFAGGLFFITMEEIAWGQQYLHFNSPEFVKAINEQNEFTLHNVGPLQARTDILNTLFGIGGLVGVWLSTRGRFYKIGVPVVLAVWYGLILLVGGLDVVSDLVFLGEQVSFTMNKQTETVELLIALAGLLYLVLNTRAFRYSTARPTRILGVRVRGVEVVLGLADGREVGVEADWLEGVGELVAPELQVSAEAAPGVSGRLEEIAAGQIAADGQSVVWEKLGREIQLAPLLEPRVPREDPADLLSFGWWRWMLWAALGVGLVSLIWLWLIPGDPKNAWVLGLSRTRP